MSMQSIADQMDPSKKRAFMSPKSIDELEILARNSMHPIAFSYYVGASGDSETLDENRAAFRRYVILPDYLTRDASSINMRCSLLGGKVQLKAPIGFSPTAFHRFCHKDGEKATARAAESRGIVQILTAWSNYSLEEVRKAAPNANIFQNCYMFRNRQKTLEIIRRAEAANFMAIVVSIDIQFLSTRRYKPLTELLNTMKAAHFPTPEEMIDNAAGDPAATWEYFEWITRQTKLPVIVKGVLTPRTANQALAHGAAAVMVSNHGGRQLDGLPATVDVLPSIVRTVAGRCDVYVDGGVRTGNDVFKLLGLGATAVFVGRPQLWGLAYAGQEGVEKALDILINELRSTMQLASVTELDQIANGHVIARSQLAHL